MTTSAPLIGLTTYGRNAQGRYELPAAYSWAVYRAGGVPALVPPVGNLARTWLDRLDALILTGGGDLDPALYDGDRHDTVYNIDPERDAAEMALARAVLERELPVLAICRGLQVLNVAMGGTLHPHLPDVMGDRVDHRLPPRDPTLHKVRLEPDSRLARLLGVTETEGVSWHHQGIRNLADGLVATAYAPDELVEAVELPDHPWLIGVQWHPEMSAERDPVQQRLFDELVSAARMMVDTPSGSP